jgi:hypothetical protein
MPILLVIGRESSQVARDYDRFVFSDPEVAERISRVFIPVRIDLHEQPNWEGAVLPLTRVQEFTQSGFEAAVFTPSGELAAWHAPSISEPSLDTAGFLSWIGDVRSVAKEMNPPMRALQARDLGFFWTVRAGALPDADAYLRVLLAQHDDLNRGFPESERQELRPWDIRLLAETGWPGAAEEDLDRILGSPMIDWVHGGSFLASHSKDWMEIEPSKTSVATADLAALLARMSILAGRDDFAEMAVWLAESVNREFLLDPDLPGCIAEEVRADGRSERWSHSFTRMTSALDFQQRKTAQEAMGLNASESRVMVPLIASFASRFESPEIYDPVLTRLAQAAPQPVVIGGKASAHLVLSSIARILEVGVVLDDPDLIASGLAAFESARSLFVLADGQVQQRPGAKDPLLSAYVGCLDAMVWSLAAGREESRSEGLELLDAMEVLFALADPVNLSSAPESASLLAGASPTLPRWFDSETRSVVGQLADVMIALAAVSDRGDVFQKARSMTSFFTTAANQSGRCAGGLMGAAERLAVGRVYSASGPEAPRLLSEAYAAHPGITVFPISSLPSDGLYSWTPGGGYVLEVPLESQEEEPDQS